LPYEVAKACGEFLLPDVRIPARSAVPRAVTVGVLLGAPLRK
jgi:hypothetical protein